MRLLIQLTAFRQVANCLFHMGGENVGFRGSGKQLFRAACVALAISRLSGHHPLIPKQHFQELLMIECHRLLSCFHFPWRKEYLASVVSLMTALQLSWFFLLSSWSCSGQIAVRKPGVATDAFPLIFVLQRRREDG